MTRTDAVGEPGDAADQSTVRHKVGPPGADSFDVNEPHVLSPGILAPHEWGDDGRQVEDADKEEAGPKYVRLDPEPAGCVVGGREIPWHMYQLVTVAVEAGAARISSARATNGLAEPGVAVAARLARSMAARQGWGE